MTTAITYQITDADNGITFFDGDAAALTKFFAGKTTAAALGWDAWDFDADGPCEVTYTARRVDGEMLTDGDLDAIADAMPEVFLIHGDGRITASLTA